MARVRLCILMAGSPVRRLISSLIVSVLLVIGKSAPLVRSSWLPRVRGYKRREHGAHSDVLIRSANSARKRVVHEDNRCIASFEDYRRGALLGRARRVIEPERFRSVISRRLKIASLTRYLQTTLGCTGRHETLRMLFFSRESISPY